MKVLVTGANGQERWERGRHGIRFGLDIMGYGQFLSKIVEHEGSKR